MKRLIKAVSLMEIGETDEFEVDAPTTCPICGVAYASPPLDSYFILLDDNPRFNTLISSTYFCPHCEQCFLVNYSIGITDYTGTVLNIYPNSEQITDFSDNIENLSPEFVDIFHQAEIAENSNLTKICGIGYRKALEFLIKDYAIYNNPDCREEIKKCALGKCINNYIKNPQIQTLAKASAWLGNDETHYIQKHENYNISDMKRFIFATIAYINFEFSYAEAASFLNSPQ